MSEFGLILRYDLHNSVLIGISLSCVGSILEKSELMHGFCIFVWIEKFQINCIDKFIGFIVCDIK